MPSKPARAEILGLPVDLVDWNQVLDFCRERLQLSDPAMIVTLNGEIALQAQSDQQLNAAIKSAKMVLPESANILFALRWLGYPQREKLPGVDLVYKLAGLSQSLGTSIYLLGGEPEVANMAAQKLRKLYPSLKVAGTSSADPDEPKLAAAIKSSGAEIVFVAYGAPKQEIWINRHGRETGAKILVGIGGALDMISGRLPRAPSIMRLLHLEWLWRMVLQPKRVSRIWRSVAVFPLKVLINRS